MKASVTTPSFSDIFSESVQTVEDFMVYGTVGYEKDYTVSDTWSLDVGAKVEVGYMNSELDSRQRNVCRQCGADQQDFTVNVPALSGNWYGRAANGARGNVRPHSVFCRQGYFVVIQP